MRYPSPQNRAVFEQLLGSFFRLGVSVDPVPANYTIKADADVVASETDKGDNVFADDSVRVRIPGDVDGNDEVNFRDLFAAAAAYAISHGHPNWNPMCAYAKVNFKDLFMAAGYYHAVAYENRRNPLYTFKNARAEIINVRGGSDGVKV